MATRDGAPAPLRDRGDTPIATGAAARRPTVAPSRDREDAFAGAKRRSARVRFLRKAIPIGAVAAAMVLVGAAFLNPFGKDIGSLGFSAISVEGTKIAMAHPRLTGFRSDGQPYSMTAEKALQDIKHPTLVEMRSLTGEIGDPSGRPTRIRADAGLYDSVAETMRLTDNVRIGNGQFEVRLRSADIEFKTGIYKSAEPVEVLVSDGTTIFGDKATARNNGQELIFEGHVRTRIVPQPETAANAGSGGSQQ